VGQELLLGQELKPGLGFGQLLDQVQGQLGVWLREVDLYLQLYSDNFINRGGKGVIILIHDTQGHVMGDFLKIDTDTIFPHNHNPLAILKHFPLLIQPHFFHHLILHILQTLINKHIPNPQTNPQTFPRKHSQLFIIVNIIKIVVQQKPIFSHFDVGWYLFIIQVNDPGKFVEKAELVD
jgi:hypothetical protein